MTANSQCALRKNTAALVFFLACTGIFAVETRAQGVCEGLPQFGERQMLSQQCTEPSEVLGNVLGADMSAGLVTVSFDGLSLNKSLSAEAGVSGEFHLRSVPAGSYEVLVAQTGRILSYTKVTVSSGHCQIIFQISNKKPPLISPTHLHSVGDEFD
jgi:hypothetical protein